MSGVLDGIRVIDFTQVVAGPYATLQLALLGADVIKIEHPGGGDLMRRVMAEGVFLENGVSPVFQNLNLAKRSLTLDLKAPGSRDILQRLTDSADVIVENFRPGVMAKLGLDYTSVSETNPDVVYCSISGYGQSGPKSGDAAYDGPVQAETGLMSINGHPQQGPTRIGFWAIDAMTGMNAAMAINAALVGRSTSGRGQHIDVAMIDSAVNLMSPQIAEYLNAGHAPRQMGNKTAANLPTDNVFSTSDGKIQITAINEQQIANLFRLLNLKDQYNNQDFATAQARLTNADKLHNILVAALKQKSAAEWHERLKREGIPCSPIQTIPEFLTNAQVTHRQSIRDVQPPGNLDCDSVKMVDAGYRFIGAQNEIDAAPLLGEHTKEILNALGYTDAQQDKLTAESVT